MEVENRRGAHSTVHQVLMATAGRGGSPAACANNSRGHPQPDAGLGSKDRGGGALRSNHDSKQGSYHSGHWGQAQPNAPTVHCSTEAPNHPVSGPLYR